MGKRNKRRKGKSSNNTHSSADVSKQKETHSRQDGELSRALLDEPEKKPLLQDSQLPDTMDTNVPQEASGKTFTTALIAFIVGFVLAFLIFGTGDKDDRKEMSEDGDKMEEVMDDANGDSMMEEDDKMEEPTVPAEGTGGSEAVLPKTNRADISADNQAFGDSVNVVATSDRTAWVTVYEDVNGVAGSILGAKRVDEGRWQVTVKLLRATEADKLYYVKLLADDGDGKFDFSNDLPIVNELTGKEVMSQFRTTTGTPRG